MTMADHALIERAASAAGKHRAEWDFHWLMSRGINVTRDMLWNPLENSGHALELAAMLPGLNLQWVIAEAYQVCDGHPAISAHVRRAITIAAGATVPQ